MNFRGPRALPDSHAISQQLTFYGLFRTHLRNFRGSRKAGFLAAVSDFALIVPVVMEGSFAQ